MEDDEVILRLIEDLKPYINSLIYKFRYYTCLDDEDLMQEGYYKIVYAYRKIKSRNVDFEYIVNYIKKAIVNHFINIVKANPIKIGNEKNVSFLEGFEYFLNEEDNNIDDFYSIYNSLDEKQKILFTLVGEGYRQNEIAKILDYKSQGTVSKNIKKLREAMRGENE